MWHAQKKEIQPEFRYENKQTKEEMKDLHIDEKIILKLVSKIKAGKTWPGLIWLQMWTNFSLLQTE